MNKHLQGQRVIENEFIPEGCFVLDEGRTLVLFTPHGWAVRVDKPYLVMPKIDFEDSAIYRSYMRFAI